MGETRNMFRNLVGNPLGKKSMWKTGIWEDDIKMELGELDPQKW
jgi:hypothetical protein